MASPERPAQFKFSELREGEEHSRVYRITAAMHKAFLDVFGDRNPIHLDSQVASDRGFRGPVMHGGILNGLLSHFVGMVFPGDRSLLLSSELRFHHPAYLEDEILLHAKVEQLQETHQTVVLRLRFEHVGQKLLLASGQAMIRLQ